MKKAVPILTVIIFITSLFFIPTKKEIKLRGQFSSKDLKNSFPSEYEWMKRSFPHFKVDPSAHLEALKQTKD